MAVHGWKSNSGAFFASKAEADEDERVYNKIVVINNLLHNPDYGPGNSNLYGISVWIVRNWTKLKEAMEDATPD